MLIDDAVAKGLTHQFIAWWQDDLEAASKKFQKQIKSTFFKNRNGFHKFINLHQSIYKKFSLSYYVGGSNRHPYIGFVGVCLIKEYDYKNWIESTVLGSTNIISISDKNSTGGPAPFSIGEHALSRIFQRSGLITNENITNPYIILSEMNLVPMWASFWHKLIIMLDKLPQDKKCLICPVIPTENGLLICELGFYEDFHNIEVRTYLHESMLGESQKYVRNLMLEASRNLENSILAMYPHHLETPNPTSSAYEFNFILKIIFHRLRNDFSSISEVLLKGHDSFKVYELTKNLNHIIADNNFNIASGDDISQHLKEVGYQVVMDELRLAIFKND